MLTALAGTWAWAGSKGGQRKRARGRRSEGGHFCSFCSALLCQAAAQFLMPGAGLQPSLSCFWKRPLRAPACPDRRPASPLPCCPPRHPPSCTTSLTPRPSPASRPAGQPAALLSPPAPHRPWPLCLLQRLVHLGRCIAAHRPARSQPRHAATKPRRPRCRRRRRRRRRARAAAAGALGYLQRAAREGRRTHSATRPPLPTTILPAHPRSQHLPSPGWGSGRRAWLPSFKLTIPSLV